MHSHLPSNMRLVVQNIAININIYILNSISLLSYMPEASASKAYFLRFFHFVRSCSVQIFSVYVMCVTNSKVIDHKSLSLFL